MGSTVIKKKNLKVRLFFIFFSFFFLFLFIGVYSYFNCGEWFYDSILGIVIIILALTFSKWLKLGAKEYFLVCLIMCLHVFGAFGFYNWSLGVIHYDNVVHFFASLIGAYLAFNFVVGHFGKEVVCKKKFIFMIFVFSLVLSVGVLVEMNEFFAGIKFGEGEGLFFIGPGDISDAQSVYFDTISDIMVNIFGIFVGIFLYYIFKFKKLDCV